MPVTDQPEAVPSPPSPGPADPSEASAAGTSGAGGTSEASDAPYGTVEVARGVTMPAAPTRKRGRETATDMVRSLLVILVPVLVLVFIVARQPSPDPVRTVDWQAIAAGAAAAADFPVVGPTGEPARWRATSARYEPVPGQSEAALWHLGFISAAETYVGMEQSDADAESFVRDVVDKAVTAGEVSLGGATWTRYTVGANGYRSLVRPWGTSTVVVTGSADWRELEAYAGSLAVVPPPSGLAPGGASPSASAAS